MNHRVFAAAILATIAAFPAHALDVHILAEGEVRAILGTPPANAQANVAVGINEAVAPPAQVKIPAEGGATATVTVAADVIGLQVFTDDGINFGSVVAIAVATDGEALLVVDLNDGWLAGIETIAIRTSAVTRTAAGLQVDETEADLKLDLGGETEIAPATPAPAAP